MLRLRKQLEKDTQHYLIPQEIVFSVELLKVIVSIIMFMLVH